MKTILVPTDFSDYALYALKVAASIARKIKAKIKLVHVYNLPSSGVSHIAYYENFFKEIRGNAERQLEGLAQSPFLKGMPVDKHMLTDKLMWELVTSEKFKNVSLIIMGSHGKGGFSKAFIGSNTEKVVRLAEAPVLTIKSEPKAFNIRKIVFASDFEEEGNPAFKKIKFLIDSYKPKLYLLKVITPSDFESTPASIKRIQSFIRRFSLKNATINVFNYQRVESGIIEFSHDIKADLIIIPTHGRKGLAHLISGSLAESLVRHEQKPILSIRIPHPPETPVTKLSQQVSYENWGGE